ncbi:hypothetical protein BGZ46_002321, partial [Entomortierella lignicola]
LSTKTDHTSDGSMANGYSVNLDIFNTGDVGCEYFKKLIESGDLATKNIEDYIIFRKVSKRKAANEWKEWMRRFSESTDILLSQLATNEKRILKRNIDTKENTISVNAKLTNGAISRMTTNHQNNFDSYSKSAADHLDHLIFNIYKHTASLRYESSTLSFIINDLSELSGLDQDSYDTLLIHVRQADAHNGKNKLDDWQVLLIEPYTQSFEDLEILISNGWSTSERHSKPHAMFARAVYQGYYELYKVIIGIDKDVSHVEDNSIVWSHQADRDSSLLQLKSRKSSRETIQPNLGKMD